MASDSKKTTDGKGVIFSGMRPTGRLHLGNYLGALKNWVALQQEYRCIYSAVDVHALTTVESPAETAEMGREARPSHGRRGDRGYFDSKSAFGRGCLRFIHRARSLLTHEIRKNPV